MRKHNLIIALLLFVHFGLFAQHEPDFYTLQWSQVHQRELKHYTSSAYVAVDTIYQRAKAEPNYVQLVKALIFQSKFVTTLRENHELDIVNKFKEELTASDPPLQNILHSILAQIYWQYYQTHRWQFYRRTQLKTRIETSDFRTWDLRTLFEEIHVHFQRSLHNEQDLQKIPLEEIDELLELREGSKRYRPTLYDFLAHSALDFYQTTESRLTEATNMYEIRDEALFDHSNNFEEAIPNDSLSLDFHALRLYHKLLRFHSSRKDTAAFIMLELDRLEFLKEHGVFADGDALYINALERLRSEFAVVPASTLIEYKMARYWFDRGDEFSVLYNQQHQFDKRKTMELCESALGRFPDSDGAEKCRQLQEQIRRPSLSIQAEGYVSINTHSRLLVNFANVERLTFHVYKIAGSQQRRFERLHNDSLMLAMLSQFELLDSWDDALPDLEDYQEHSTEMIVPPLEGGNHLIIARVPEMEEVFGYAFVQATDLVLVENSMDTHTRFQVVDRMNGAPLEGARVRLWNEPGRHNVKHFDRTVFTDKDGFCYFEAGQQSYSALQARIVASPDTAWFSGFYLSRSYQRSEDDDEEEEIIAKPFVFTDRSIYRPGQTIYFKGILTQRKGTEISVVAGEFVEVYLYDPNEEEVSFVRLKTNQFGSFSGEFKLPKSGLTGRYSISAEEDYEEDSKFYEDILDFEWNELYFSVEEYKRPRFEVTFEPTEEAYRLRDTISVDGKAMAFAGAPITDAKVVFKVTRSVRYPGWYYWYYSGGRQSSEAREITFGESITGPNGSFRIDFVALPDEQVSGDEMPVFEYVVSADVTDINGETRTAETTIRVGYHTMEIAINVPQVIEKGKEDPYLTIGTENLNGQEMDAAGSLKVYRLKTADRVLRNRPWPAPDLQAIPEDEFIRRFPHDSYFGENSSDKREQRTLVYSIDFDTNVSDSLGLPVVDAWMPGEYMVEVVSSDPFGQPVVGKGKFKLKDGEQSDVDNNLLVFHSIDKSSYTVGDKVLFTIGSASDDVTVTIDIEKDHKLVDTRLIHLSRGTHTLSVPVKRSDKKGFAIFYHLVNYNSFVSGRQIIDVHEAEQQLHIETATFRDKLQPGKEETWSFTIQGSKKARVEAEALASMYDASLDQFTSHEWRMNLRRQESYYGYNQNRAHQSFQQQHFRLRNLTFPWFSIPGQQFDRLDWFGFSLNHSSYAQERYLRRLAVVYRDTLKRESRVSISNDDERKAGFIYGQVTSDEGEPVPGVNVLVKGTDEGVITDINGEYAIRAKKGDELVYSFVGMVTTNAEVVHGNIIDVEMVADIQQLSEVVVTAMGVQKKANLTGSIIMVAEDEMIAEDIAFEADVSASLQGQMAGVSVQNEAGESYRVLIRGIADNQEGMSPIYVVDGVIVDAAQIAEQDLASVSVLKGDNATALYGSRAANGVILITTKSGQEKLDEELAKVRARKNLKETAFFYPHLKTDKKGRIKFTFTTPEALTRWKLQLLAHTKELATSFKTLQAVTTKDLMITPNTPRFLRQEDEVVIKVKITNRTDRDMEGVVGLQLSNPFTGEDINELFNNLVRNKKFTISPRGNTEVSWSLAVPENADIVQYKFVAKAGNFSDGEQNVLPILSNRTLVTETIPMHVRSGETKTFSLDKLKNTTSPTLQHHRLTLEVTSNPTWYALQALPYLMEFPYDCAEQTFARYYSNALAMHIVNQNRQIKAVFDSWATGDQLQSNLQENEELKSIMIQETPWLKDALSEEEQKKQIARLFEETQVKESLEAAIYKLEQLQLSSGGFPWFSGSSYADRYITQHIMSGLAHLQHLDVDFQSFKADYILKNGLKYLDKELARDYNVLLRAAQKGSKTVAEADYLKQKHLRPIQIQYLYAHSFFPDSIIAADSRTAHDYYMKQAATYWTEFGISMRGMIALVLHRSGKEILAKEIVRSLKETSITNEELGMYWKQAANHWRWDNAPIETQALLIEAISEIEAKDTAITDEEKLRTIDNMKVWLLKNKQTNRWPTTKSTTEAIYALLLKGSDWLSVTEEVGIRMGDENIALGSQPENGTGYFKSAWSSEEIDGSMGDVSMTKKGKGIAWGGLYWQYFEDLDKITRAETPLKLEKSIFKVINTSTGEVIAQVNESDRLQVGDLVRIRIELSVDREMEYIHMKDMRAAGMEPVNVLSGYKWQDGLGYYESTRDASTNFFIDDLPKGVYVFEYDLRVNNSGHFSNGITIIQSMYAPEFSSHSDGIRIIVE